MGKCCDDVVLSCSEDSTVKVWDVPPPRSSADASESEENTVPRATLRGHRGAALALACKPEENLIFSGGVDHGILVWRMPPKLKSTENPSSPRGSVRAEGSWYQVHNDAVWSLDVHPRLGMLASAGAESVVRVWRASGDNMASAFLRRESLGHSLQVRELYVPLAVSDNGPNHPTCVSWVPHADSLLLACYTSSPSSIFDVEVGAVVRRFEPFEYDVAATSIAFHTALGFKLAIVGYVDGRARVYHVATGEVSLMRLRCGTDVISSVGVDSRGGFEVAATSHDGLLRIFDSVLACRCSKCRSINGNLMKQSTTFVFAMTASSLQGPMATWLYLVLLGEAAVSRLE